MLALFICQPRFRAGQSISAWKEIDSSLAANGTEWIHCSIDGTVSVRHQHDILSMHVLMNLLTMGRLPAH